MGAKAGPPSSKPAKPTGETLMSETATPSKSNGKSKLKAVATPTPEKKAPVEKVAVTMGDGRVVHFPPSWQVMKETNITEDGTVSTRFDFSNGMSRVFTIYPGQHLYELLVGAGIESKIGDALKQDKVEDKVKAYDAMAERLRSGEWKVRNGDGTSTIPAVILAIMNHTGKTQAQVEEQVKQQLTDNKMSRQQLYAKYRESSLGPVIEKIEAGRKKVVGKAGPAGDDLLSSFVQ